MLWWTLQQLKSARSEVRAAAARKLGESGEKRAVPALIGALADEDAVVRTAAAKTLAAFVHPGCVEPLAAALAGPSRAARSRRAAPDRGTEAAEYEALATALGRQGEPAVAPLMRLLGSDDREARRWAAFALGLTRSPRAVGPLAERLEDNRSEVRRNAAHALGEIGDSGALPPLKKGLASRDPDTRRAAAEALGAIGGEDAAEGLAAATEDANEAVQLAAVEALRRIGGLCAGRGLRRALEAGKKKGVSEAAAAALKAISFNPTNAEERAAAAVLAGDFAAAAREGQAATDALVEALDSRDPERRRQAVEVLGSIRPERAIPSLLKTLKDYDSRVREMAARALAGIGLAAVEGLNASLESPDATVACLAARALGQIGDARAVTGLVEVIVRNRSTTSAYPEMLEAVRAAAGALETIIQASAFQVGDEELERVASAPDGWLEHPEAQGDEAQRRERAVDCTCIRELAQQELHRRGY